jgi:hypothetical protein
LASWSEAGCAEAKASVEKRLVVLADFVEIFEQSQKASTIEAFKLRRHIAPR